MKKAFTLAEVLLAILIIGVLITLTTPSILLSYEKNTTQAGFADVFKDLNKGLFNYSKTQQCQGKLSCTTLFTNDNMAEELASTFHAVRKGTNCWNGKSIYNKSGKLTLKNVLQERTIINVVGCKCFA